MTKHQFKRLKALDRASVAIKIDGADFDALEGDTVLTAMLLAGRRVRLGDIGKGDRAGFCLMGACQDCFVWLADGGRVRACTTPVSPGLSVVVHSPDFYE